MAWIYLASFIKYNQSKGIDCFQSDLFNLNLNKKFDFLTGLHTIFAFVNFKEILTNYLKLLNKGGYLIIDVVNLHMYDDFSMAKRDDHLVQVNGMKLEEIYTFLDNNCEVCEIINHDFFRQRKNDILEGKAVTQLIEKLKKFSMEILNVIYFKLYLFKLFDLLQNKKGLILIVNS